MPGSGQKYEDALRKKGTKPSQKLEPFETEIVSFLHRAFSPSFSENKNTSRPDVLLENIFAESGTILDLCSGWPLLLQRIIETHADRVADGQPCRHKIKYIACDTIVSTQNFKSAWKKLEQAIHKLECGCIAAHTVLADVSELDTFSHKLKQRHNGQFDYIIISNSLHELDPEILPSLLHTITSELLVPNGKILLIDPDPKWILSPDRWNDRQTLSEVTIDWESNAIWLPAYAYENILADVLQCSTSYPEKAERSEDFWYLTATKRDGTCSKDEAINGIMSIIHKEIVKQTIAEFEQIKEYRENLVEALSDHKINHRHRELAVKALRFFCCCASQTRRFEVLERMHV